MQIAGYTTTGELGRGGMGIVYRAVDRGGREVAVKLLRGGSTEARSRFERERRLLASFSREEGFVPLLDSGDGPHGPFLVMPLLAGGTLRDRLRRGAISIPEAIALAESLAAALAHAHRKGVVHRDLKPENVLFAAASGIGESGPPLVADLGLAKHFSDDVAGASLSVDLSRAGEMRGTVGYMAPEQLHDAREAGPPADVFALGAILHECIAGWPAFEGRTLMELLGAIDAARPRPLANVRPETPPWLAALVERALARTPGARFADASELLLALRARESGFVPRRRPRVVGAIGAGVLVAGALVFSIAARRSNAGSSPVGVTVTPTAPPPPVSAQGSGLDARLDALLARLAEPAPVTSRDAPIALLLDPRARRAVDALARRLPVYSPADARAIAHAHPTSPAAAMLVALAAASSRDPGGRALFRASIAQAKNHVDLVGLLDAVDRAAAALSLAHVSALDSGPQRERETRDRLDAVVTSRALAGFSPELGAVVVAPLEDALRELDLRGPGRIVLGALRDLPLQASSLPPRVLALLVVLAGTTLTSRLADPVALDASAHLREEAARQLGDRPLFAARALEDAVRDRLAQHDLTGDPGVAAAALTRADEDLAALVALEGAAGPGDEGIHVRLAVAALRRDIAWGRVQTSAVPPPALVAEGLAHARRAFELARAVDENPERHAGHLRRWLLEAGDAAGLRIELARVRVSVDGWEVAESARLDGQPERALELVAGFQNPETPVAQAANLGAIQVLAALDLGRVPEAQAGLERLKAVGLPGTLRRFRIPDLERALAAKEKP